MHVAAPPLTWVGGLSLRDSAVFETVLNFHINREALRRVEHFNGGHLKAVLNAQQPQIDLPVLVDSYALMTAAVDDDLFRRSSQLHPEEGQAGSLDFGS